MIRAYDDNGNIIDLAKWEKNIREKAIDDVMNKAKEIQEEQIKNLEQHPRRSGKQWAIYMNTHLGHIQIACKRIIEEQLKVGGKNE